MKYSYALATLFSFLGLAACTPSTAEITVQAPVAPQTVDVTVAASAPEPIVIFTPIEFRDVPAELERIAKQVHPQYSFGPSTFRVSSSSHVRFSLDTLSSGLRRVVFFPSTPRLAEVVMAVVAELERAGVLRESGIPDIKPVPVPLLTLRQGEEFFRFYLGPSGGELLAAARQCGVDYARRTEPAYSPGFEFMTTDMSDGRTRLFVEITASPGPSRVGEMQAHLGKALACLDLKYGVGADT